MTTATHQLKV